MREDEAREFVAVGTEGWRSILAEFLSVQWNTERAINVSLILYIINLNATLNPPQTRRPFHAAIEK